MEGERDRKRERIPNIARELWFREAEKRLIMGRRINATVRAGDRTAMTADPKGGCQEGRFISLQIQRENGEFFPLGTDAVVCSVSKKEIGDIKSNDLAGTPLAGKTKLELIEKLSQIYGRRFADSDIVTVVRFEYRDNLKNVEDLIRVKAVSFAREPKGNPQTLEFPSYTIPLLEHDYPAKTAVMWNAAYQEFNISAGNVMVVGNPSQCRHIIDVLRRDPKYKGGGAGVGFKDEVVPYLDELEPLAKEIGAVNFILKTPKGKLKGYNTDGSGYAQSLEEVFRRRGEVLHDKKALILGAGGAGNAVAFALAERGMRIVILNRTIPKARDLADRIKWYFGKNGRTTMVKFDGEEQIVEEVRDADVIINVSTKGSLGELEKYSALAPARLPASETNVGENLRQAEEVLRIIPSNAVISDIVLGREPTPLLQMAKEAGFEILDGLPMVTNQGVEAFWLLYGELLGAKGVTKEQIAEVMKRAAGS